MNGRAPRARLIAVAATAASGSLDGDARDEREFFSSAGMVATVFGRRK